MRILLALALFAASPDMDKLTSDLGSDKGRVVESALKQLKAAGPAGAPAVPAIVKLLKEKKTYGEQDYGIDNVVYPAAFETLKAIGTRSDDVLLEAIDYYQNGADYLNVKPWALDVIGDYGEKAAPAVPALVRVLEDANGNVRSADPRRIVKVLERIGPAARAAVPVLSKLATTSVSGSDRAEAFSALAKIAPRDRQVLKAFSDVAWKKPGNSGDMEVGKAFIAYLAAYDKFDADDLASLAGYLTKITDQDETERNHAGHIMSSSAGYLEVARIFVVYPEKSDLIMPSLAVRIRQLDLQTRDFRAVLELAGSFGAHAAPLVDPIFARATSREHVTVGFLQPLAIQVLQKIGTPEALEKAKTLSARR